MSTIECWPHYAFVQPCKRYSWVIEYPHNPLRRGVQVFAAHGQASLAINGSAPSAQIKIMNIFTLGQEVRRSLTHHVATFQYVGVLGIT